jgi:hypothetical protein
VPIASSSVQEFPEPEPRQTKRRRLLPARLNDFHLHDRTLRDVLPQPPVPAILIPPTQTCPSQTPPSTLVAAAVLDSDMPLDHQSPSSTDSVPTLDTPRNAFSIFRRYHATTIPSHDPDAQVDLTMLSNLVQVHTNEHHSALSFDPYPNESAFLLGEWYWTQGTQKSQKSFNKLVNVLGNPSFSIPDIQSTNWTQVNTELAVNDWDKAEWVDEDAGWQKSSVTIHVPFYHNASNPGIRDFTVPNFYHRSLTSVIREKLKKHLDFLHFHLEPYELIWHPPHLREDVHLQSELYTSSIFNMAHQELQAAAGEPGCNLPRVVLALMFWSDSTHLTSFGKAKLWPVYMFFGNESKYRRCKPSEDLCEHIAYFENVCYYFVLLSPC